MMKITEVTGAVGGEAYLLDTGEKTALIDTGFAHGASKMLHNVQDALWGRDLDYVLLTHSHYDHAGGSAYVKDLWPDCEIIGSKHAKDVFDKKSAVDKIRDLSENAAKVAHRPYKDQLSNLTVDRVVGTGDVIDMGDLTLSVYETPGHTRCCISFYSAEEEFMIASETLGVIADDKIYPCYLVGYEMTLDSIRKMSRLPVKSILVSHSGVLEGRRAVDFFSESLFWHKDMMRRVQMAMMSGASAEQMRKSFISRYYAGDVARMQPKKAFMINLDYTLPMLMREAYSEFDKQL